MTLQIFFYAALLAPLPVPGDPDPPDLPTNQELRFLLASTEPGGLNKLIRLGDRLFPQYEQLLADETTNGNVVHGILSLLTEVKADRSRFVEPAVARLASPWPSTRMFALDLVARIGSERDAAPVVALLSDEHLEVAYKAAKTLAAIGGPRELVALDAWLLPSRWRPKENRRDEVVRRRDELKQRLEKAKKPPK